MAALAVIPAVGLVAIRVEAPGDADMHCFYCAEIGTAGEKAILDGRDVKHLFKTLRARSGEQVELTDGKGTFAIAEIGSDRELVIVDKNEITPPPLRIHLYVAPPKKQKMDALLKQCAEIGVWSINPMITARSVSTPEKNSVLERWRALLLEGCKQSKNPFLPEISMPISFEQAVGQAQERNYCCFYGSPRGEKAGVTRPADCCDVAWFVGPEGGFSPEEEAYMLDRGVRELKIGPWVLRVETAAVCGSSLLQWAL